MQAAHGFVKVIGRHIQAGIKHQISHFSRQMPPNGWAAKTGVFKKQAYNIAFFVQRSFNITPHEVIRGIKSFQSGGSQQDEEVCPCSDVIDDGLLKVSALGIAAVKKHIVTMRA